MGISIFQVSFRKFYFTADTDENKIILREKKIFYCVVKIIPYFFQSVVNVNYHPVAATVPETSGNQFH